MGLNKRLIIKTGTMSHNNAIQIELDRHQHTNYGLLHKLWHLSVTLRFVLGYTQQRHYNVKVSLAITGLR